MNSNTIKTAKIQIFYQLHDFQNALFTTLKKWKFNTPIIYFKACCPFSNKYANFKRFYRHFIKRSSRESWTCPFFLGQNTSIKEMGRVKSDHLFGEIMDGPVALRPLFSALDWQWKSYKNLMSMTNLKIDNILILYSTEKCWKMEIRFTGNHLDSKLLFFSSSCWARNYFNSNIHWFYELGCTHSNSEMYLIFVCFWCCMQSTGW